MLIEKSVKELEDERRLLLVENQRLRKIITFAGPDTPQCPSPCSRLSPVNSYDPVSPSEQSMPDSPHQPIQSIEHHHESVQRSGECPLAQSTSLPHPSFLEMMNDDNACNQYFDLSENTEFDHFLSDLMRL